MQVLNRTTSSPLTAKKQEEQLESLTLESTQISTVESGKPSSPSEKLEKEPIGHVHVHD